MIIMQKYICSKDFSKQNTETHCIFLTTKIQPTFSKAAFEKCLKAAVFANIKS